MKTLMALLLMVWCWVAAAQAIWQYCGHDVDQAQSVSQVQGQPVVAAMNAQMMVSMLNQQYTCRQGVRFSVRTARPIGTKNHAMVLVGMVHRELNGNIMPRAGSALDPAPTACGGAVGPLQLRADEMTAYVAVAVMAR